MIRFRNTRTGREVAAKDGRDLAAMVKIEQDRRGYAESRCGVCSGVLIGVIPIGGGRQVCAGCGREI